jgi:hypothetical protein
METDKKVVDYSLLTYIVYGVTYIFLLNGFIVPLPIIYLMVPAVALFFFIRSIRYWHAVLFLLMPLVVMKDILFDWSPKWIELFTLFGILSWSVAGWLILKQLGQNIQFKTVAYFLLTTPIVLIPLPFDISWIWFLVLSVISFTTLNFNSTIQLNTLLQTITFRYVLLQFLMTGLYSITLISRLLN